LLLINITRLSACTNYYISSLLVAVVCITKQCSTSNLFGLAVRKGHCKLPFSCVKSNAHHEGVPKLKRHDCIMSVNSRTILWTCLTALGTSTPKTHDNLTNHVQWPTQRLRFLACVHLQTCASSSTYPRTRCHLEAEMSFFRSQPRAPTNG